MKIPLLHLRNKSEKNSVHIYEVGKTKILKNEDTDQLITKTIAKTTQKLNSLGYYGKSRR